MDARLGSLYAAAGGKRLSRVECVDVGASNQHEFNGVKIFRELLGDERRKIPARFIRFEDGPEGAPLTIETNCLLTWYDAREGHPTRTEYRFFYPAEARPIMAEVNEGDFMWLALSKDGALTVALAKIDSQSSKILDRLFQTRLTNKPANSTSLSVSPLDPLNGLDMDEASILEILGVPVQVELSLADKFVTRFGGKHPLPSVEEFSQYAREVAGLVDDPITNPDDVLLNWWDVSESAFFAYERHVLQPLLDDAFAGKSSIDVDLFFSLAARFKNSRFSRAGKTFESHLQALFKECGIRADLGRAKLPDGSKPDFLMPSTAAFLDEEFPVELLTFLGAKTSAKERWRQLADEAKRLPEKYLATLDRYLTKDTLSDMNLAKVIPVIPAQIQSSNYNGGWAGMLVVAEFLERVREREDEAGRRGLFNQQQLPS